MGLTAYLYKSRLSADKISLSQLKGDKEINDLEKIAYFRNNWKFHHFVDNGYYEGYYLIPLSIEKLKEAKTEAQYCEDFNKDYGDGQSVLSVIDVAIIYIEYDNYTIFYSGHY